MNKWRGLANEGLHDPNEETAGKTAWCQCCGAIDCRPAAPCWCCEVYRADVEVERLTAERDALRAQVQRVRELHHFVVDEIETREGPEDVQHCSECGYIPTDEEPCPTIRALDGDSDG